MWPNSIKYHNGYWLEKYKRGKVGSWKTSWKVTIPIVQARDDRNMCLGGNGVGGKKRWDHGRWSKQALLINGSGVCKYNMTWKSHIQATSKMYCHLPKRGSHGRAEIEFNVGHINFKMSTTWSNWDIRCVIKYLGLGFGESSWIVKHLSAIGIYVVFKTMGKIFKELI